MYKSLNDFGFPTANRVFTIAEIGINHGGKLDVAKHLIDSAVSTGADAVKFQTYLTEKRAPSGQQAIFDILKQCELPLDTFASLKQHAEQQNIEFFSTPFDEESVDCLEAIGCRIYKVASFDVVNRQLLRKIAQTQKTVIMSVGMAALQEIEEAYTILTQNTQNVAILHCISAYPTQEEDANLAALFDLRKHFPCVIGQSDHTPDIVVPLYAVAAGAQIIEKHFKIDESMDCIDAPVSITENQFKTMVSQIRRIEAIFGESRQERSKADEGTRIFRRSTD